MLGLVGRRVAGAVVTLLVLSVILFLLLQALPGDPASSMLGLHATPDAVARIRRDFGLDAPLPLQYLHWLAGALRGDLGYSLAAAGTGGALSGRAVSSIVLQGLRVTVPLATLGMLVAVLL